jgi:hypothetical protein
LSFNDKRSNIISLTLTEMFVNLKSFQDFLSLLDGHFNQLHRFPVEISFIVGPFIEINKKVS